MAASQLWVRVEVSEGIGLGHLMRSVAVAQAARRQGITITFVPSARGALANLPNRFGFPVRYSVEPENQSWLGDVRPGDYVLFDGYSFSEADHLAAAATGARVAQVDDVRTGRFSVDLLVNSAGGDRSQYTVPAGATVLLGPRYTLVREEFLHRRRQRAGGTRTLLVIMGGSDATGATDAVLGILSKGPFDRLRVILGPGAPALGRTRWAVPMDVERDPPDLATIFDGSDAAVTAAGNTTWELLAMGVPTALIQVADNQQGVVRTTLAGGAALFAGQGDEFLERLSGTVNQLAQTTTQRSLSAAGLRLVDGHGADRVFASLTNSHLAESEN